VLADLHLHLSECICDSDADEYVCQNRNTVDWLLFCCVFLYGTGDGFGESQPIETCISQKAGIMREYLRNHVGLSLFINTWLTLPLDLVVVHFLTKTPLPWHECFRLVTPMIAVCSVFMFLLGLLTDANNRDQLKRDFLRKLES